MDAKATLQFNEVLLRVATQKGLHLCCAALSGLLALLAPLLDLVPYLDAFVLLALVLGGSDALSSPSFSSSKAAARSA